MIEDDRDLDAMYKGLMRMMGSLYGVRASKAVRIQEKIWESDEGDNTEESESASKCTARETEIYKLHRSYVKSMA